MHDRAGRTKYDRLVVEDPYRTDALCRFIADLERKGEWPGIVFVRKRRHAELFAKALSAVLGKQIPAVTSAATSRQEREALADRMRRRDPSLPAAVATAVWSTGLNVPSLSWVMMAGAGQAPIGLKQSAGRATRLAEEKAGYTIYDVQDVGPGLEWAQEQAAQRMRHYAAAGFAVDEVRPQGEELDDEDAMALADLLALEDQLPAASGGARAPPVDDRTQRGMEIGGKLAGWFLALLGFVLFFMLYVTCGRACK
jgi:superfamily II DNA or RNA helicase